jgi:8-oxo-dGTP diphosphatase
MVKKQLLVVAAALIDEKGRYLMQRRSAEKDYAGLWEFPGGKVEPAEVAATALIRELREELDIKVAPEACKPTIFAEDQGRSGAQAIVICLYTIAMWEGEPRAMEGGELSWFLPEEMPALELPPLDRDLASRLPAKTS